MKHNSLSLFSPSSHPSILSASFIGNRCIRAWVLAVGQVHLSVDSCFYPPAISASGLGQFGHREESWEAGMKWNVAVPGAQVVVTAVVVAVGA
jgi:hypothetical protein